MKIRLFILLVINLILAYSHVEGQTYVRVVDDSVRIVNGELIIENSTMDISGPLMNLGSGRTQFTALELARLGDSAIAIVGMDTLDWVPCSRGEYYVLSSPIPVSPGVTYRPQAFKAPVDSGKVYQVEALVYLKTNHPYDTTSFLKIMHGGIEETLQMPVSNVVLDSQGHTLGYLLRVDKLVESALSSDSVKISFLTNIQDLSGTMSIDSLCYLYIEEVFSRVSSPEYTVDTPAVPPVKKDEYFVVDSAAFNFTPVAQQIDGWTDVLGDPSKAVVSANSNNGWTISTVSTSLWRANINDSSAVAGGMYYTGVDDPYDFVWDTGVVRMAFINTQSEYVDSQYNLKISGLDSNHVYKIQILGSLDPFYVDNTLADPDVFGTRTRYQLSDGRSHSLNTIYRISHVVTFDTVHPDLDGNIWMSITGQDTTYNKGSIGVINGLKIWDITKADTVAAGKRISLFHYNYDTTMLINDGTVDRLCVIYRPYHYDPSKTYPLLIYLTGQESTVQGDAWDNELVLQEGLGLVAENEAGKIYGIASSGDTLGFCILIPQTKQSEWSLSPLQLNTLVDNFKSLDYVDLNSQLFISGFSSGGLAAVNYAFQYPSKVNGVFSADPAQTFTTQQLQNIRDSAVAFANYGHYVYGADHGDVWGNNIDTLSKYMPPSHLYRLYYAVGHRGFTYEYKMDAINPLYQQNMYDFFINPTKNRIEATFFKTASEDARLPPGWFGFTNQFLNPQSAVQYAFDTLTGIGLNSVSTTGWSGAANGSTGTSGIGYDFMKYYVNDFAAGGGIYTKKGTFQTTGPNLRLTGLNPAFTYNIYLFGFANNDGTSNVYSTVYTVHGMGGTDSVVFDNKQEFNKAIWPAFKDIVPLADSTIDIGVYPDWTEGATTYAKVSAIFVVQNGTYNHVPIVYAGSDQSIVLPRDSVLLTGSAIDFDGQVVSRLWRLLAKPGGSAPVIVDSSELETIVRDLDSAGVYSLELAAEDDSGSVVRDTMQITVVLPAPSGDSTLFNFNYSTQNVPGTIDASGSPGTAVITATDSVNGWSISSVGTTGNWQNFGPNSSCNNNGATTDDGGGFPFGTVVGASSWYSNGRDTSQMAPNLVIGGLDDLKTYALNILCSVSSSAGAPHNVPGTMIHINQDPNTYKVVDEWNNTSQLITYTGIRTDGNGHINISLNSSGGYFIINGLKLKEEDFYQMPVGDRILIDLGSAQNGGSTTSSPDGNGRYWNCLGVAEDSTGSGDYIYSAFVDTANHPIPVSINKNGTWWNSQPPYILNTTGNASGVGEYPATATQDNWVVNSNAIDPLLMISLPPGTYSIKFWGSRATSGTLTSNIKLSSDATYQSYDASNNADFHNAATINGIASDGINPLIFNVSSSGSSNGFGYYGIIDIRKTGN